MSWVQAALAIAALGYSAYQSFQMRKKSEAGAAEAPSKTPYVTESDIIPVVFGTVELQAMAIVESTGPRQAAGDAQLSEDDIERWWEWNFVRAVLCHGRIDAAYFYVDNELGDSNTFPFGATQGLEVDGGKTDKQYLSGWVYRGDVAAASAPPSPSASLSDLAWQGANLRLPGLAYMLAQTWQYGRNTDRAIWSAKPQFPDGVTVRVKRTNWRHGQVGVTGWGDTEQWQLGLAVINAALGEEPQMNPAHILRELLTDRIWGMGLDEDQIDDASFLDAAQYLFDEEFGLSYLWTQETSAAEFAAEVLRHIDGILYQEPTTGLYTLRLIYTDSNTLHDLTSQAVITGPPEYTRPSYDKLVTRVTVIYRSLAVRREQSFSVHDMALTEELGDIPVTIRYDGIYSPTLAAKIAGRDLRRLSTPLAQVRLSVSWSAGKDIRAGDRVQWRWPEYGIFGMRLRVVGVSFGELDASSVILDCIEDVTTSMAAIYAPPQPSAYVPPNYTPVASQPHAFEAPIALAGFAAPGIGDTDTRGGLLVAAPRPVTRPTLHTSWDLAVDGVTRGTGLSFAETVTTGNDLAFSGLGTGVSININFAASFTPVLGTLYLCSFTRADGTDEIVTLLASTATFGTVSRGVYDTTVYYGTVPTGTTLHVIGDAGALSPTAPGLTSDGRAYVVASTVSSRALTRTSQEVLPFASALSDSVTMANRQIRPTCPGFVAATFASGTGTTITWRRRNRLTNPTCTQTCPDVTPETGTTHRLIIEGLSAATGGVFVQVQNLTLASSVTSYLYTKKNEEDDHVALGGPAAYFDQLRLTLYSTRSGYDSWQRQIRVRT